MDVLRKRKSGARFGSLSETTVDHILLICFRVFLVCVITGLFLKVTLLQVKDELKRYESSSKR